ncbi:FHA domain-containing protein [Pseudobutyrivibrio sp. YE44]|uniref:DUF6382 domain-containing protein n=1 Tax=Pseudobutyrivibrio sp. YE44 TaxID=1520802 RepID=UPI00088A60EB|nr:DUF6382 domain-containing protein [Pseudobutyrivibrio sp. YE44]SDB37327.1 FHA domain-containing protein [Pseudobutyrivibrio sp. YE44]
MEIQYKRQHSDSFMVVDAVDTLSSYEEKMIEENAIEHLLEMKKVSVNGVLQYNYNISRKENLEDYLESHDFTLELFKRILLNLQLAYEELGKYLINERHIWLSPETVYFEKAAEAFKLSLCYYPKDMGSVQEQFRKIMEYAIKKVPSSDREFAAMLCEAYDLTLKEDYTLGEILDSLQQDQEECPVVQQINLRDEEPSLRTSELTEECDVEMTGYYLEDDFSDVNEADSKGPKGLINKMQQLAKGVLFKKIEFKDDFKEEREDFVFDPDYEYEERTVLLSETKPCGKLVYDGLNQEDDFLVTKDVFRIGKSKSCDAVLHAPTVSGNHAKITREGDDYYLTDLNSTNATYINEQILPYRKAVKLNISDKIRFANVAYTFF